MRVVTADISMRIANPGIVPQTSILESHDAALGLRYTPYIDIQIAPEGFDMSKIAFRFAMLAAGLAALPTVSQAHFRLLAPAFWIEENQLGDPQKAGPCGGTNTDYGKPTYAVTEAKGGSMLHIKVQETVYHPGHYRVALAVNSPTELPLDPKATTTTDDKGRVMSVSAEIMNPVAQPVLADGLFQHSEKTITPFETDVAVPNINCKACTLQVVQFMEQHPVNNPGNFTYHHCAVLHITADSTKPLDAAWPKERN